MRTSIPLILALMGCIGLVTMNVLMGQDLIEMETQRDKATVDLYYARESLKQKEISIKPLSNSKGNYVSDEELLYLRRTDRNTIYHKHNGPKTFEERVEDYIDENQDEIIDNYGD